MFRFCVIRQFKLGTNSHPSNAWLSNRLKAFESPIETVKRRIETVLMENLIKYVGVCVCVCFALCQINTYAIGKSCFISIFSRYQKLSHCYNDWNYKSLSLFLRILKDNNNNKNNNLKQ